MNNESEFDGCNDGSDFESIVTFSSPHNLPTEKAVTTNDLSNMRTHDVDSMHNRMKSYDKFIDNYVSNYSYKFEQQSYMKVIFFSIIVAILIIVVVICLYLITNVAKKESLDTSGIAALITSIIGLITAFMTLPKIIAENLFPKSEDDQTALIFNTMVENDIAIRNIYNGTEKEESN